MLDQLPQIILTFPFARVTLTKMMTNVIKTRVYVMHVSDQGHAMYTLVT